MTVSLKNVFDFTKLLNLFGSVERTIDIPHRERKENDIEHSYHLAMLAWYIADSNNIVLNKELLLKYSLIHDIVEVYAGDTFLYSKNQDDHDTKKDREESARLRIEKEFPEFKDLHASIVQYEKKEDKESRFVYVLDKLHPVFQIYLNGGKTWRDSQITLEMLIEKKADKALLSDDLLPYWEELISLLKKEESILFSNS